MLKELPPSAVVVPRWIAIALGEIGVRENPARGVSNPRIEQYHAVTSAGEALDDVPWCSSFVCWCMEMAGVASTRSKAAASWSQWGVDCTRGFGCIIVFGKHDKDARGTGHVGFCLGTTGHEVFVLGGNQKQRVGIDVRDARKIVTWRWPEAVQLPKATS